MLLLPIAAYGSYNRNIRALRAYSCLFTTLIVSLFLFLIGAAIYMSHETQTIDVANSNSSFFDSTHVKIDFSHEEPLNKTPVLVVVLLFITWALIKILEISTIVMAKRLAEMICTSNIVHLSNASADLEQQFIDFQHQQASSVPVVINERQAAPQYPNPYFTQPTYPASAPAY